MAENNKESSSPEPMEVSENSTEKKSPDSNLLDLAFAMDCTGSMGSYIHNARENIRMIVEDLVAKEAADIRLALVEYRDHPPQDSSFVTRVHDFTKSVREMKGWLEQCSASGGGDAPEAVADALHQVLKLSWRDDATKMCVFISDAPPHGLGNSGDGFPNGCPDGLDPMTTAGEIAQKGITLYLVGCEPAILRYKEFFSALAHITGGQYVPLKHAKLLSKVIIGGAQEEISLQKLLAEVEEEIKQEAAKGVAIEETEMSSKILSKMNARGVKSKQMLYNNSALPEASSYAQSLSKCSNMKEMRSKFKSSEDSDLESIACGAVPRSYPITKYKSAKKKGFFSSLFGGSAVSEPPVMNAMPEMSPEMASCPPAEDDVYEVQDDDIKLEQVTRMVRRQVKKNNIKTVEDETSK